MNLPEQHIAADRVTALAEEHRRRFDWYRELLSAHGVGPGAPLAAFPLIDQDLLERHYYSAEVPDDCHAFHTSGTATGRRKRILYDDRDESSYAEHRRALFDWFTADLPRGASAVADLGTGHAAATARRVFDVLGFDATDIDFQVPIERHVEILNDTRPDLLFTMPMMLERIMCAEPAVTARPSRIAVVGDVAPPAWRRAVAERFGLTEPDVLDVFGSIEIGAIAYSNAETGLYHFHDHIIPEVMDPETGTVDERGGDGVLVLTSLERRRFPALRYVTGDRVSGLRTIVYDGQTVAVVERIEGRVSGDLKHGERLSLHDVSTAVARVFPGRAFEVDGRHALTIRVAVDRIDEKQREAIREMLCENVPDVGTMIRSGLVAPIEVVAAGREMPVSPKRQFAAGTA